MAIVAVWPVFPGKTAWKNSGSFPTAFPLAARVSLSISESGGDSAEKYRQTSDEKPVVFLPCSRAQFQAKLSMSQESGIRGGFQFSFLVCFRAVSDLF